MHNRLRDIVESILTTSDTARAIAKRERVSKSTVHRYGQLLAASGRVWDGDLELLPSRDLWTMFNTGRKPADLAQPDFDEITKERALGSTSLQFLWECYAAEFGDRACSYSQFTKLFRAFQRNKEPVMTSDPVPGEVLLVDFSGKTLSYYDRASRSTVKVQVLVGVMEFSNLTFARVCHTQSSIDWIGACDSIVRQCGRVPTRLVFDNLKAAVTKTGVPKKSTVPLLNTEFADWGRHYGIQLHATRPGHPRDKGRVEGAVRIVQEYVRPRLRHRKFFSLEELDAALQALMVELNDRLLTGKHYSRSEQFLKFDRPAMRALPKHAYAFHRWIAKQTVPRTFRITVEEHEYSVPHTLIGERVEARVSVSDVEIHHQGRVVAVHPRSSRVKCATIDRKHEPEAHRAMRERTPDGMRAWAKTHGPGMAELVDIQLRDALQGLDKAVLLRNLDRPSLASGLLEQAALRALAAKHTSPADVRQFLQGLNGAVQRDRSVHRFTPPGSTKARQLRRASRAPSARVAAARYA